MKIQCANKSIKQLWMGYPTVCVYQFTYNEKNTVDTNIIQYFIMHGLGLYTKVDSVVAHMLYSW